jgi:hypothetical protein
VDILIVEILSAVRRRRAKREVKKRLAKLD